MLDLVGLDEHLDKKPRQLSGGQQQRVAIARTLALNPDVILFDEPMSALDVDTRLSLRSELKELQKRFGTTMIYITHDQEEAFAMSDRIMVMDAGVIHQLDTPQNIIDHPADDYVSGLLSEYHRYQDQFPDSVCKDLHRKRNAGDRKRGIMRKKWMSSF